MFREGDIISNNSIYYLYIYNKDCNEYMFRRIKPLETIWWHERELKSICRHGNLFDEGISFSIY